MSGLFDAPGSYEPEEIGSEFFAEYVTMCNECGQQIFPGDTARMTCDGAIHTECV